MSKPSDIPQWAWDEAIGTAARATVGWTGDGNEQSGVNMIEQIARALLSAYERGRGEQRGAGTPARRWDEATKTFVSPAPTMEVGHD